ncbi:MAG: aminodeoxychorismate lyase, partial [Bilophila wadsworthia]
MNESPEETQNTPAAPGASRPEETGIPSSASDTRNQQAPPDQQHSDASSPEAENRQPTEEKPGEASPLDGEEPETPQPASAPETPNPKRLWPRF